jgi:hypothetical protein
MRINKSRHRRRPAGRRKVTVSAETVTKRANDLPGRPVSVRSVSGLGYPVRGKLGRDLAEERS